MADELTCPTHGRSVPAFLCRHLMDGSDLGFFYAEDPGNPYPDAWCSACDDVLQRIGEWNSESEAFAGIHVVCSGCYTEAKRRNCDNHFTYKCDACSQVHQGVPGLGWDYPAYYHDIPETERPARVAVTPVTCVIDGQYFYVRGSLEIPVVDASESLLLGVWVSLSAKSYQRVQDLGSSPDRVKEPPFFGWLCNRIPGFPDTRELKTHVWLRGTGTQPAIALEPTDHPLAVYQREGVTTEVLRTIYDRVSPGRFSAA